MNQEENNGNEMPVNSDTGVADNVSVNTDAIINDCIQTLDINRLAKLLNENLISQVQYNNAKYTIEQRQRNANIGVPSQAFNMNQQTYYSGNTYDSNCSPHEYDMLYKRSVKMYTKVIVGTIGYLLPIVNIFVLPLNVYLLFKLPFSTFYFPSEIYREQFKSVRLWTLLGFIPFIGWPLLFVAIFKAINARSRLNENIIQYKQMYNMRNF